MLREATVIAETGAALVGNLYGRELASDSEGKLCTSLGLWRAQYGKHTALWDCLPVVYSGLPFLLLFVFFVCRGFYTNPPPVLFYSDSPS